MKAISMKREPPRIFSGSTSRAMWASINKADTVEKLRDALYDVCCKLQELEAKLEKGEK